MKSLSHAVHDTIYPRQIALAPAGSLALIALLNIPAFAIAADLASESSRLEEVEVIGARDSALTQAPTQNKLDALQPQSIIGVDHIANSVVSTADYAAIANLAPGVSNVQTNGPGLSESRNRAEGRPPQPAWYIALCPAAQMPRDNRVGSVLPASNAGM